MAKLAGNQSSRKGLLIWMILSQLLTAGYLFIWLLTLRVPELGFDVVTTPVARAFKIAWDLFASPAIPIALVAGAWIAYARRKDRAAAVLSGLSFMPPVLLCAWVSRY